VEMCELRLLEILKKRYHCDVDIHFMQPMNGEENPKWEEREKNIYRNRHAKFVMSDDSIYFPIYRADDIFVAIEVCDTNKLSAAEITQIKDCVELVFNDLYVLRQENNLLKQRQSFIESQRPEKNVIPFRAKNLH